jgi:hypothetical protein
MHVHQPTPERKNKSIYMNKSAAKLDSYNYIHVADTANCYCVSGIHTLGM